MSDPVTRVLELTVRDRHEPSNQFVIVAAPPGGGKTTLVETVACSACSSGLRVGVACPRASQAFDLARRLRRSMPEGGIRLRVGRNHPVPADLRGLARGGPGGPGSGPGTANPVDIGTVQKLAYLAACGDLAWDSADLRRGVPGDPGRVRPVAPGGRPLPAGWGPGATAPIGAD